MDITLAFASFAALLTAWALVERRPRTRPQAVPIARVKLPHDGGEPGFLRNLACYP